MQQLMQSPDAQIRTAQKVLSIIASVFALIIAIIFFVPSGEIIPLSMATMLTGKETEMMVVLKGAFQVVFVLLFAVLLIPLGIMPFKFRNTARAVLGFIGMMITMGVVGRRDIGQIMNYDSAAGGTMGLIMILWILILVISAAYAVFAGMNIAERAKANRANRPPREVSPEGSGTGAYAQSIGEFAKGAGEFAKGAGDSIKAAVQSEAFQSGVGAAKQAASSFASRAKDAASSIVNADAKKAQSVAEQLKTYKDLLDQGIITQEDFDTKKAEILKASV